MAAPESNQVPGSSLTDKIELENSHKRAARLAASIVVAYSDPALYRTDEEIPPTAHYDEGRYKIKIPHQGGARHVRTIEPPTEDAADNWPL